MTIMMNSSFSKIFTTTVILTFATCCMSHDCDNAEQLPTGDGIITVFGMDRLEDASHSKEVFDSSIPIISNPHYDDESMEYTHASTSTLFVIDNKPNPYGWCWDACEPYESDEEEINAGALEDTFDYGSYDTYEGCWEECERNSTIYYGLSYFHRLNHDETWHFYFGDVLYLYELDNNAEGDVRVTRLGADTLNGEVWQHTVKAGTWFATQTNPDSLSASPYTFGSTMYSPIFEQGDYELADKYANYTTWDIDYPNAKNKIIELSFYPDYTPPNDDPYAETGMHSLCRSDSHDFWHQYALYEELTLEETVEFYEMDVAPKPGYYKMVYESEDESLTNYGGIRTSSSSMYYAMNDTAFFHKQNSDETYHFYNGEPIILYVIDDSQRPRVLKAVPIGNHMDIGEIPHYTVPKDTWIAFEFKNNNYTYWNNTNSTPYALLGLTNAPGYDDRDLEYGVPQAMIENFPEFASTIASLYATGTAQGSSEIVYVDPIGTPPGGDDGTIGGYDANGNLLTSQQSAFSQEAKPITKGGKVFLYLIACLCFVGMIALFVKTSRRSKKEREEQEQDKHQDEEDQYSFKPPQSVTLVCERDGIIQDTEILSLPSSRGSSEA